MKDNIPKDTMAFALENPEVVEETENTDIIVPEPNIEINYKAYEYEHEHTGFADFKPHYDGINALITNIR